MLRQQHRPGEKLFIDWAGATLPLYDPATGQARPMQLFVAVLGASNDTYAEATADQQMGSWIGRMQRPWSSSAAVRNWWFPITPAPAYPELAAMNLI